MVPTNKNLIWGAVVIVGGVGLALLFRREETPALPDRTQTLANPTLPRRSPPPSFAEPAIRLSPLRGGDFADFETTPSKLPPNGEPFAAGSGNSRPTVKYGKSTESDFLPTMPSAITHLNPAKRHVLRDGDTLSALAQRYLGSASRANEIYEFNRQILKDPDLLPIGKTIQIPSGGDVSFREPKDQPLLRPLPPPLVE
jgi:nucleoid-associated protein YgaU